MAVRESVEFKPQEGPQEDFLASEADIAIYGGGAGGGKTMALLLDPLRHLDNPDFGFVIFRRTSPEIRNEGGLWDESSKMYTLFDATPVETRLTWLFPSGMKGRFSHMEHEKTKYNWQGSQIPLIGFDELTHFSESQFFYLVSRNRSARAEVPGYIRATCNPDADSWVSKFIAWWINQETGQPIKARSGVLRYFVRSGETIVWGDSKAELKKLYPDLDALSVTFIPASVYDNKILLEKDPSYLAKLKALPRVERERLLNQNWLIRPAAGLYFKEHYFKYIDALPPRRMTVRFWDLAGTEKSESNDPAWTVGVKMSRWGDGIFCIEDVKREQYSPAKVEELIKNTATADGKHVQIGMWQDPGQAGKAQVQYYAKRLAGFTFRASPASESKIDFANPLSAQAEAGNIRVLRGPWNKSFFTELENFPEGKKNDQVDASSGAFLMLTGKLVGEFTSAMAKTGTSINQGENW